MIHTFWQKFIAALLVTEWSLGACGVEYQPWQMESVQHSWCVWNLAIFGVSYLMNMLVPNSGCSMILSGATVVLMLDVWPSPVRLTCPQNIIWEPLAAKVQGVVSSDRQNLWCCNVVLVVHSSTRQFFVHSNWHPLCNWIVPCIVSR